MISQIAWRVVTLAALALSLSSAASADDLTGRVGAGGSIGPSFLIGSDRFDNGSDTGLGGGGWLGYGINRRWSARVGYDNYDPPCARNGTQGAAPAAGPGGASGDGPGKSIETVHFGAAYALAPASAWNPHVRLGVGPAWVHGEDSLQKETKFGVSAGLGADRFVARNVTVGAALDWVGVMAQGGTDAHALRPGLTAGYWFGGPK